MTTTKTTPAKSTRPRTAKQPQDHQPSAEEKQAEFEELEGHELLKPITQLKAWEMTRVQGRMIRVLGEDLDLEDLSDAATSLSANSLDFDALADFMEYIGENYALDQTKFDDFATGEGAQERTQTLVMGYAGAMGKDSRSTDG